MTVESVQLIDYGKQLKAALIKRYQLPPTLMDAMGMGASSELEMLVIEISQAIEYLLAQRSKILLKEFKENANSSSAASS